MLILALESSCDETAAAVSRNGREILADVVYSQADMHALYGGVVPEIASRKHIEKVSLVAAQALEQAGVKPEELNRLLKQFDSMNQMMKQMSNPKAMKKFRKMGGRGGFPGGFL